MARIGWNDRMRIALLLATLLPSALSAFPEPLVDGMGKRMLDSFFERSVAEIESRDPIATIETPEQWNAAREEWRQELQQMLGLSPWPKREDLQLETVGRFEHEGIRIERLHYQSVPGLYVAANLYRPASDSQEPRPAILYVCGHAKMEKDGVRFGNKTGYHHHGLWFARHGYVCLTIDTVQRGELPGEHHGTARLGKHDWMTRGYTPAGLEAWNGIRALDYLTTLPEVDASRIGVTGRSGGGAYSWWIGALDDRVKVVAPTAGITDLRNHILDGVIEGHCDCMYPINTGQWDFDQVAALVAPRPLLISNTDADRIFPLDGVVRVHASVSRLYRTLQSSSKLGLHIAPGPHKDTHPLHTGAFHWFEVHLKGLAPDAPLDTRAPKEIDPSRLKVFIEGDPEDSRHATLGREWFPVAHPPSVPETAKEWTGMRKGWSKKLSEEVFCNWPEGAPEVELRKQSSNARDGVRMTAFDFESDSSFRLRLYLVHRDGLRPEELDLTVLNVLDQPGWEQFCRTYLVRFGKLIPAFPDFETDDEAFAAESRMHASMKWGMAYLCPRGVGETAWEGSEAALNQVRRRFYLLGRSLEEAQVWDIRRGISGLRQVPGLKQVPLWLQSHRQMAVNTLFASLHDEPVARIDLHQMPDSLTRPEAPIYLQALRHLDLPQAAAMASTRSRVILYGDAAPWTFPLRIAERFGEGKSFAVRESVED